MPFQNTCELNQTDAVGLTRDLSAPTRTVADGCVISEESVVRSPWFMIAFYYYTYVIDKCN